MSKTAFTIRIYSFYLFIMGLGMVLFPSTILPMFGFPATTEIWIKILGLFTFTTGIYYFYSSAHEQLAFFKATVLGRIFFFAVTVLFVFVYNQNPMLAGIGSIDLFGAAWTFSTFKNKNNL